MDRKILNSETNKHVLLNVLLLCAYIKLIKILDVHTHYSTCNTISQGESLDYQRIEDGMSSSSEHRLHLH